MHSKVQERHKAIDLRKQGKSYSEILKVVPVSKGTLSKWFQNAPLTKKESKYLQERTQVLQDKGRLKVATQNKEKNEARRERLRTAAKIDFERYKKDPLFLIGLTLYWAQGSQTDNYCSFTSSDTDMIKLMVTWVTTYLKAEPSDYSFRLYSYDESSHEANLRHWSRTCTIPKSQFKKTVLKRGKNKLDNKGILRFITPGASHIVVVKTWQECLKNYYGDLV